MVPWRFLLFVGDCAGGLPFWMAKENACRNKEMVNDRVSLDISSCICDVSDRCSLYHGDARTKGV